MAPSPMGTGPIATWAATDQVADRSHGHRWAGSPPLRQRSAECIFPGQFEQLRCTQRRTLYLLLAQAPNLKQ